MRKFLLASLLIPLATAGFAVTRQALTLHMKAGACITYYLDTEPSISFRDQSMIVAADNEANEIPMEDVSHWEIGVAEYSSTESIDMEPASQCTIRIDGNTVTIQNPVPAEAKIYDLSGKLAGSSFQENASFTLPQGIYVIKIADNTYKIAIR